MAEQLCVMFSMCILVLPYVATVAQSPLSLPPPLPFACNDIAGALHMLCKPLAHVAATVYVCVFVWLCVCVTGYLC